MDPLIVTLNQVFDREFPGSKHPIGPAVPNSPRVGGYVVWNEFESKTQIQRQAAVWKAIRDNVEPSDQRRITAILTLTEPEEQGILENE